MYLRTCMWIRMNCVQWSAAFAGFQTDDSPRTTTTPSMPFSPSFCSVLSVNFFCRYKKYFPELNLFMTREFLTAVAYKGSCEFSVCSGRNYGYKVGFRWTLLLFSKSSGGSDYNYSWVMTIFLHPHIHSISLEYPLGYYIFCTFTSQK